MDTKSIPPHIIRKIDARLLGASDRNHLTVAEGYVDLAMPLEAHAELDEITPEKRALPSVLAVRLQVYLLAEHWELATEVRRTRSGGFAGPTRCAIARAWKRPRQSCWP